jgi:hypothetical protein
MLRIACSCVSTGLSVLSVVMIFSTANSPIQLAKPGSGRKAAPDRHLQLQGRRVEPDRVAGRAALLQPGAHILQPGASRLSVEFMAVGTGCRPIAALAIDVARTIVRAVRAV